MTFQTPNEVVQRKYLVLALFGSCDCFVCMFFYTCVIVTFFNVHRCDW